MKVSSKVVDPVALTFAGMKRYFVYISTNPAHTVLYIGFTHDLRRRLFQHQNNAGTPGTFAGKYFAYCLLYYEEYPDWRSACHREKQIKKWRREKKLALIRSRNPNMDVLYPQDI